MIYRIYVFTKHSTTLLLCLLFAASCNRNARLDEGFLSPPDSVKVGVYWYWISDNISENGVVKDLYALKAAGVNRVFIGHIGLDGVYPHPRIKLFTDEWWNILHTALKTAGELGVEVGLFNSPGWSQSGGPWVQPEQAMRYLASSETRIKGGQRTTLQLERPTEIFQDVRVIALPVAPDYEQNLAAVEGAVLTRTADEIQLRLPCPATVRSLTIRYHGTFVANVAVRGGALHKRFAVDRPYMGEIGAGIGFRSSLPVTEALPETTSDTFAVHFDFRQGNIDNIDEVVFSATPVVERYAEKTLAKVSHRSDPAWNEYIWADAPEYADVTLPQPSQIIDLTQYMNDNGTLNWDAPEGDWLVMRTGMAPTGKTNDPAAPEGKGPEIDKMNRRHAEAHFEAFIGEILRRIPAADRRTLRLVVMDSYEAGSQNFTDDFLASFRQRYNYDALPFLPTLAGHVVGSPDLSDRFLWDLRRFVADRIAYEYVGGMSATAHCYGLRTWLENYGSWGFTGEFLQYGGQSDAVGGEFWDGQGYRYENRLAASCAHTYGKPTVSSEAFTSFGPAFSRYPANFKRFGDWAMTEGVNDFVLHVSVAQPSDDDYPGVNAFFGNEFNRKNTWFEQLDLFTLYLKRCCYLLQQGQNVADIAYFIGDDAPKMTGPNDPPLPDGYSFDYINSEVIINRLTVNNGQLTLPDGTSYKILVLPRQTTMRPETLRKIERLVKDGAVVLGIPPRRSPSLENYPAADSEVHALSARLWGDGALHRVRNCGRGKVFSDGALEQIFDTLGIVPDCRISRNNNGRPSPVRFVHRKLRDGGDIYFLSNQSGDRQKFTATFRVTGMQPELWDALEGNARPLPAFELKESAVSVPLQLDENGSAFVVFRSKATSNVTPVANLESGVAANFPLLHTITEIATPWTVTFSSDSVHRGPAEPVVFGELSDWSHSGDERIRYYSGTAVYKTTFSLPDTATLDYSAVYLELGKLTAMAKVKINGMYAGGVWTAPYRVNVGGLLKPTDNTLEIEVVNTWLNRIIGDLHLPENERRVKIYNDAWYREPWSKDSPLQESGLVGTVKITGTVENTQ